MQLQVFLTTFWISEPPYSSTPCKWDGGVKFWWDFFSLNLSFGICFPYHLHFGQTDILSHASEMVVVVVWDFDGIFSVWSCNVLWPSVNWNRHVQVMYCNHLSSDYNQVQRDLQRFIFGSKYFNILQSNILFDILNFVQSWLPLGRLSMLHAEDIEMDFVKSTFSRNCVLYTWSANKI